MISRSFACKPGGPTQTLQKPANAQYCACEDQCKNGQAISSAVEMQCFYNQQLIHGTSG